MDARSFLRLESRPLSRVLLKAIVATEIRVPMIVMTTRSSMRVKPCRQGRQLTVIGSRFTVFRIL